MFYDLQTVAESITKRQRYSTEREAGLRYEMRDIHDWV